MISLTREQNEELRHAALEVLAVRHPVAMAAASVRRRIVQYHMIDFDCDPEALSAALHFLAGLELVAVTIDELGSTGYFAATPRGVLAHERGTLPNR